MTSKSKAKSKAQQLVEAQEALAQVVSTLVVCVEKLASGDHVSHIELRNLNEEMTIARKSLEETKTTS